MRLVRVAVLAVVLLAACSAPSEVDGGVDASHRLDAGADAGGPRDAGVDGGAIVDAAMDAALDAGAFDAGVDAAVTSDGGALDGAALDGAMLDAAMLDGGAIVGVLDGSVCGAEVLEVPPVPSPHVTTCSDVTYGSNPPTSGPHYPIWAAYTTYTTPVPWGYLVHDMEHGGVVIAYDCPSGCDADVAALQAFLDARPADPMCADPVHARIVLVPEPGLGVRFAAAAWGWALRSDCLDLAAIGAFIDAHYAHAPENECANGIADPSCPAP